MHFPLSSISSAILANYKLVGITNISESVSSGLAIRVEQALDWRKTEFVTTDQLTKI